MRIFRRLLMGLVEQVIPQTQAKHSGTVIFFHGSGDTGHNLAQWIIFLLGKQMEFPHLKVIIPTAPVQPYTPMGGQNSNVWFDRRAIDYAAPESRRSMASMYEIVSELIQREINLGISPDRIIVGGFSMGGALSLHIAYHLRRDIAGVFACSSFLNKDSVVYESLQTVPKDTKMPKLLMFHGDRDTLVPMDWGRKTFDKLTELGVQGEFVPLKNTLHELKTRELKQIIEWINTTLPPLDSDLVNKL
ncbi:lysophospholipase-like protein 1 [Culicoides brevitarsis]|uniref:lysophospholipase-like protein 1 n=1 Tax=Culicoides brevitarsis TaxID=469753 RepID=UPI00307BC730